MSSEPATSRTYIHTACGQPTEVSGSEFMALADPLAGMERTVCSGCGEMDSLTQFAWADTGELISDYYLRHLQAVSPEDRRRASRRTMFRWIIGGGIMGLLISIGLGWIVTWYMGALFGILFGLVTTVILVPLLGILGFRHFEANVVGPVIHRAFGVDDVRQLV